MLSLLAAAVAVAPSNAPKVIGASLFKNGYAVVMREIPVSGPGTITVKELPKITLGTLWITGSNGIKIGQIVRTTKETAGERDATDFDEILAANVGKNLVLLVPGANGEFSPVQGKLLSAAGDIVVMQTAAGMQSLAKSAIKNILGNDGGFNYKVPTKASESVLKIKVAQGSGEIYTVGLEKGITWSPSYAIDLSDSKQLHLLAKAVVLDDLAPLDAIELKFVTGFPNVPWSNFLDPLLSGSSVDEYLSMLNGLQVNLDAVKNNPLANQAAGGVGIGGFGAAAPAPPLSSESFGQNNLPGIQAEDLFFYRQSGVTLKKGDRAYYVLFEAKADFSHLYTLEIPDYVQGNVRYDAPEHVLPPDVWHAIKFKNTSGRPLTTAPASVFKDGQLIGQDMVKYVSQGSEVLVNLTKALDVHAEAVEEEVSRDRGSLHLPNGGLFDLVNLKGTIALDNTKNEAVKMKITKSLTGEVQTADGDPKITKVAKGLQEVNPRANLEWTPEIPAGKKLTLTYTYKLYVRSG